MKFGATVTGSNCSPCTHPSKLYYGFLKTPRTSIFLTGPVNHYRPVPLASPSPLQLSSCTVSIRIFILLTLSSPAELPSPLIITTPGLTPHPLTSSPTATASEGLSLVHFHHTISSPIKEPAKCKVPSAGFSTTRTFLPYWANFIGGETVSIYLQARLSACHRAPTQCTIRASRL